VARSWVRENGEALYALAAAIPLACFGLNSLLDWQQNCPYAVFPNTPGLAWLQDPERPEPPGEETPTIYPPLSEFAYRLIATVPGYKRVSTILDLASAGVLLMLLAAMKQPLHHVLAYAWNPTGLVSFAMSGHFDSLAIVTFLAALFFLVTNRRALSMAALALSFLSKFFPVLLVVTSSNACEFGIWASS
jgi:hypothetical protein